MREKVMGSASMRMEATTRRQLYIYLSIRTFISGSSRAQALRMESMECRTTDMESAFGFHSTTRVTRW